MNPFDVAAALKTMTVLVDTREQDTTRARVRLRRIGVPVEREKLDCGDYSVRCSALSLKGKVAIGLDPGYRTGCKVAVVDQTGKVLDTAVIYPTHGEGQEKRSAQTLKDKILKWGVDMIAIGNGTASKESEIFIAGLLKEIPEDDLPF